MGKWEKRSALEWAAIFASQRESGISAARFCREQGIDYKQFLYFRKKKRQGEENVAVAISTGTSPSVSTVSKPGFMPVMVERSSQIMRLKFPGGMVVESDGILPVTWVVEAAERWLRMEGGQC